MQIFVKTLTGKTRTIHVEASNTIHDVKLRIQEIEGISAEQQRLMIAPGTILGEDGYSLSEYNIEDESTIHMVRHLLGMISTFTAKDTSDELVQYLMTDCDEETMARFYHRNMEDVMGIRLED